MKKPAICVTTILLSALICFASCKKDALVVKKEKNYQQINAGPETEYEISPSISLTLWPNGQASIRPGGDIYYKSTYKIKGKEITVEITSPNPPLTSYFTIISDTELHGRRGEVLMLRE